MCSPLVSCVFVALLQPYCSWELLLAWRIPFQDCIADTSTRCGAERRHFTSNLGQSGIFNGTAYANPELGMKIQWKTLARQKAGMELHSHPIVRRRSTTKGSERWDKRMWAAKWKECGREYSGSRCAEQKRAGRKGPGTSAWNKRKFTGTERKPQRKTKHGRWRRPGTRARNKRKSTGRERKPRREQNKVAGEGMELERGTKESEPEEKETAAWTKQSRWRRPGTSARNKRKSTGRERKPQRKTKHGCWRRPGTSARNKESQHGRS